MSKPAITVTNVSKVVAERPLLTDVSFTLTRGSLVSLIGPNGAGKSTLIKIILGLDTQFTGSVTIGKKERIQYVPQLTNYDQHQLPFSVNEYLAIGSTPLYSHQQVTPDFTTALTHVGVSPDKLGQRFLSLSGGEQQRIAIARALLAEPTVLVLDEPVASVDHSSRPGLYELIRHLQQEHGITVLLVSHDIDSVMPLSDEVLCLNTSLHHGCHPLLSMSGTGERPVHHHC